MAPFFGQTSTVPLINQGLNLVLQMFAFVSAMSMVLGEICNTYSCLLLLLEHKLIKAIEEKVHLLSASVLVQWELLGT